MSLGRIGYGGNEMRYKPTEEWDWDLAGGMCPNLEDIVEVDPKEHKTIVTGTEHHIERQRRFYWKPFHTDDGRREYDLVEVPMPPKYLPEKDEENYKE
jgi:hypothetical protein